METVRGLVRPIVTILVTLATAEFVFLQVTGQLREPIPDKWWVAFGAIILFWFSERAIKKLVK